MLKAAALAHDRSAQRQGLDIPTGGRRALPGGLLAGAPDPDSGHSYQPSPPQNCSKPGCAAIKPEELFDEQGQLIAELKDLAPQRVPTNECHSDRERWFTAQGPRSARLPQFRRCRQKNSGLPSGGERPHPRQLPPGSHAAEHVQLPRLRAGTRRSPTGWRRSTKPAGKSGLLLLAKVNCLTNSPASNWSKSGSNCAPAAASAWNG
jgi:hypothetical protein